MNQTLQQRWIIPDRNFVAEDVLVRELEISPLTACVLVRRGMTDPAAAYKFLNPSLDDLHDPRKLPDYEPAIKEILGAKERGETIYVHGDYDVDGVTSAALFTRFLKAIGCNVVPHVPHRMREGYGIHLDAVEWAREHGTSLFLTCDCGISAHEQLDAVRDAGMKAVVTDHHELKETLPFAAAVINPHREDSEYPFANLSGVGVVLKLCAGITQELGHKVENFYKAYLDLAVMGTVADVMPLIDENRIITKFGLERLKESKKPGVKAILEVSELTDPGLKLTARHIGFQIGPRINAVGRIDDAGHAMDMLLTDDIEEARTHARKLNELNTIRRSETQRMLDEAKEMIYERKMDEAPVLVLAKEGWHPGIIGIVAGRLVEAFYKPAFVIGGSGGVGKGSARTIPGFHLAKALESTESLILGGGGHEMAAGFSLNLENVDAFRDALIERAKEVMDPEDFIPQVKVEAEVAFEEADEFGTAGLAALEPFGDSNPEPVFFCRGMSLTAVTPLRSAEHAKLIMSKDGEPRMGIVFGKGVEVASLGTGAMIDIAFQPQFNTFNGRTDFRWNLCQFRPSTD